MKQTCDGSISERTARCRSRSSATDDLGIIVIDVDELYPVARKAHDAGWQLGIHANGDVAIGLVLGLYERLQRAYRGATRASASSTARSSTTRSSRA